MKNQSCLGKLKKNKDPSSNVPKNISLSSSFSFSPSLSLSLPLLSRSSLCLKEEKEGESCQDFVTVKSCVTVKLCVTVKSLDHVTDQNRDRAAGLRKLRDPRGDRDTASGQGALAHRRAAVGDFTQDEG